MLYLSWRRTEPSEWSNGKIVEQFIFKMVILLAVVVVLDSVVS